MPLRESEREREGKIRFLLLNYKSSTLLSSPSCKNCDPSEYVVDRSFQGQENERNKVSVSLS